MRHRNRGRQLGRNATHRLALMRNLAMALFRHERIITTVEKAKEARRFVERLITIAKRATLEPEKALHARRLVLSRLGPPSNAEVFPSDDPKVADERKVIVKLFDEIAPRYKDRPGGYTRVIKRHERRLGDGGKTAFLELLKEGETKVQTRQPAPAPQVADQEPSAPTEEPAPPPEQQPEASSQPAPETPPAPEGSTPETPK
jgi:large subunit ribosomal protein L17